MMRTFPGALIAALALSAPAAAAPVTPRVNLFLVVREGPAGDDRPAGRAAKESQELRGRFLDRLRKAGEIALVSDETAADGRLEILEAAVHHQPRVETDAKRGLEPHQGSIETQEEVGAAAGDERDYALTVRLTTASRFAEFSSGTREPSASSAADTVVRSLRRWIREHRQALRAQPVSAEPVRARR